MFSRDMETLEELVYTLGTFHIKVTAPGRYFSKIQLKTLFENL